MTDPWREADVTLIVYIAVVLLILNLRACHFDMNSVLLYFDGSVLCLRNEYIDARNANRNYLQISSSLAVLVVCLVLRDTFDCIFG